MRLIEKTCPKCGANLEFEPGAKEVKCSYCNKGFIIEGNENNNGSEELAPENIKLVSKFRKFVNILAIVIISLVALSIIGTVVFDMQGNKNNGIFRTTDTLESLLDISKEDQKEIEDKSLTTIKNWNEKQNDISLISHKNLGYYLVYDEFGTVIYDVYELNYNIEGINHIIYTAVEYNNVSYKNKRTTVSNGEIFGDILSYDTHSLWGYESIKDLYNNIDLLDEKLVASDGLYTN